MELKVDEDVAKCRICLNGNQDEDSESLFDERHETLSAAGKLYEELMGVQIGAATIGPQFLCNSCGLQMRLFQKLKTKAYKTLTALKQKYGIVEENARSTPALAKARAEAKTMSPPPPVDKHSKISMKLEIPDDFEGNEEQEEHISSNSKVLLQKKYDHNNFIEIKIPAEIATIEPLPTQQEKKVANAAFNDQPQRVQLSSANEIALRNELDAVLDKKVNTAEHGYATIVYELFKDVNVEELDEDQTAAAGTTTTIVMGPPPAPLPTSLQNLIDNVAESQLEEEEEDDGETEILVHEDDSTDDKGIYFDVHYLDETYEEMGAEESTATTTTPVEANENVENQKPLKHKADGGGERRATSTTGNSASQKKFTCSYCKREFSSRKSLTEHKKSDHPSKYPCPLCPKVLHSAETLRVHMNVHSGTAAYSCDLCQKTFKQKVHYQYHIDKHNNVRKFKCDVPSCGKAFITNTDLKTHKRFHSDERPFACDICGKDFLLLQHMKMHRYSHGNKAYHCDICDQNFISPNTLRYHIKTIHDEEPRFQCEFCNKKFRRKHHLHSHYKQHQKAKNKIPKLDTTVTTISVDYDSSLKAEALDAEYVDDPLQDFIEDNTEIECISVYDVEDEEIIAADDEREAADNKVQIINYADDDFIEEDGDTDADSKSVSPLPAKHY